jgi:hypothetical protein
VHKRLDPRQKGVVTRVLPARRILELEANRIGAECALPAAAVGEKQTEVKLVFR